MNTTTLVGLACLLAGETQIDVTSVEDQLTDAEVAMVYEIAETEACLPERMENLVFETNRSIDAGLAPEIGIYAAPTEETLAP